MGQDDGRMDRTIEGALRKYDIYMIEDADTFCRLAGEGALKYSRLIFAVELDESGINMEAYRVLKYLNTCGNALRGCIGGVIVDGCGELYTKDLGRRLTFAANMAGCSFPGKPLVEATGSLSNFKVLSEIWGISLEEAYEKSIGLLAEKVADFQMPRAENPNILVIHASNRKTSNSLCLWEMVSKNLVGKAHVEEISIRNGQVVDCRGCKYEDCLHFGENSSCFYGGVMVEKVYPAIIKSDILVLICPNYNDAVSANIMALINRLTAVFRTNDFSRKKVYALVISGYSGSDVVAQQIISAVNMNKNFILPAGFALMATANAPGEVAEIDGIEKEAEKLAQRMIEQ